MRRSRGRIWTAGVLAAGVLATAGCTGSGGEDGADAGADAGEAAGAGEETGAAGDAADDFALDEAALPRDHAAAAELAGEIVAEPEDFGAGVVAEDGAPDDPASRAELGPDCVWRQAPLPPDLLASLTRRAVLPAGDGAGPVRVAAVVDVHRDVRSAEWSMARTIEDAQRCPEQQLRGDERVTGLISVGQAFGSLGNVNSEDSLQESGEYHREDGDGPHEFSWSRGRIGPVTVAVSVRGAPGRDSEELSSLQVQAQSQMLIDITRLLGAAPDDAADAGDSGKAGEADASGDTGGPDEGGDR